MPLGFATGLRCARGGGDDRNRLVALFPLTPALSLGERENHRPLVRRPYASALLQRRPAWLPLPKGEGWGEGEGSNWPATTCENESRTLWTSPEILVALDLGVGGDDFVVAPAVVAHAQDDPHAPPFGCGQQRVNALAPSCRRPVCHSSSLWDKFSLVDSAQRYIFWCS
jgi:hypothetical protein